MPDGAASLLDVDIDAVREATAVLSEAGFQVVTVDGIDREESDDRKVRWTMTVEKDARSTSLNDFGDIDD